MDSAPMPPFFFFLFFFFLAVLLPNGRGLIPCLSLLLDTDLNACMHARFGDNTWSPCRSIPNTFIHDA